MTKARTIPLPAAPARDRLQLLRVDAPPVFALDLRGHHFELTLSETIELNRITGLALECRAPSQSHLATLFGIVSKLVCEEFGIPIARLMQRQRGETRYAFPRQVAMTLLREVGDPKNPHFSFAAIGDLFRREHGTVMYAVRAVRAVEDTSPAQKIRLQKLRSAIAEALQGGIKP